MMALAATHHPPKSCAVGSLLARTVMFNRSLSACNHHHDTRLGLGVQWGSPRRRPSP